MNAKVTLVELSELMSQSTSASHKVCELFLRELFATISQSLIDGETVKVKGLGTFKVTQVKSRRGVNVQTGASIQVERHNKLTFTPDKTLAAAVNQPFAQFETVFLDDAVTEEKLAEIDKQYPSLFQQAPDQVDSSPKEKPEPEAKDVEPEVKPEPKPAAVPEPKIAPAMARPIDGPGQSIVKPQPEPESEPEPEPEPAAAPAEPIERKPLLVGIPIDGPSQPVPEPEPEEDTDADRHFYRPETRNVYTPTPEQIEEASRRPNRMWIWIVLGVLAAGALVWLLTRVGGDGKIDDQPQQEIVAADTLTDEQVEQIEKKEQQEKSEREKAEKSVVESVKKNQSAADEKEQATTAQQASKTEKAAKADKSAPVTDVVTSQIVLTTLSEKHYGSPWFWVYIYEENVGRGIIHDPNNIRPGTRVVIPPADKYGIDPQDKAALRKAQIKSMEYLKGR